MTLLYAALKLALRICKPVFQPVAGDLSLPPFPALLSPPAVFTSSFSPPSLCQVALASAGWMAIYLGSLDCLAEEAVPS